jgi:hypothetical protein
MSPLSSRFPSLQARRMDARNGTARFKMMPLASVSSAAAVRLNY